MKKFPTSWLFIIIILLVIINTTAAQHTGRSSIKDQPDFIGKYFESKTVSDSSLGVPITYINIKAVRHFAKSFERAEHVNWFKCHNGIVAMFKEDGIQSRADYDTRGNWLYNIRTYGEPVLPKNIRDLVKREYYDYSITSINEIKDEQRIAYIIHIEDKTSLKTLTVYEGELNVVKEYVKSK